MCNHHYNSPNEIMVVPEIINQIYSMKHISDKVQIFTNGGLDKQQSSVFDHVV